MSVTLVVGAAPALGQDAFYRATLAGASHVVAADAAAEWCLTMGRLPDLAVGDFDSAAPGAAARLRELGCEVVQHPEEKDDTDLDLAVREALARFGRPVELTAAFTLRPDHTLAAFGTLLRAGPDARIAEPGWWAVAVTPERPFGMDARAGTSFSVVPIGDAGGVTIEGARWPLIAASLPSLAGRGVSNVAAGGRLAVGCARGDLLVFVRD